MKINVYIQDETSASKGGIDKVVEISGTFAGEQIFVKEVDSKLMRAFAHAYKKFEQSLRRFHKKRVDQAHEGTTGHISKVMRIFRMKK